MERPDRIATLRRVALFAGLDARSLAGLAGVASSVRLRAREELFHKGDEGSRVFVVAQGRLKVITTSEAGDDVVFTILGPGDVFGELGLLTGGRRSATVSALDDAELVTLHRREFLPFLRSHPEAAVELLVLLAQRLVRISEFVEDRLFRNLDSRLAKKLIELGERYGRRTDDGLRIEIKLSQTELGDLVGTSRESINKQMRAWTQAGLVRMRDGHVMLLRPDDVAQLAELPER